MFVARRELRFARGRFVLIGSVVALITILVTFLTGLTMGLAAQNVSGVLSIPADRLVFSAPAEGSAVGFADSAVTDTQTARWEAAPGVDSVHAIGISQVRAQAGSTRVAISVFGVGAGVDPRAPSADGTLGLSRAAATDLGVGVGDQVSITGTSYVVATIGGDWWYSHTPVVQMTLADWRRLDASIGSTGAYATVLAVTGSPDWAGVDEATGTVSKSALGSLTAIGAFRSEVGSLGLMVVMLLGISALVVGAFFTVWTLQRKDDIAVLKALGASTGSLVRDALGQALVVLLCGVGAGVAMAVGLGMLAGSAVPFVLSPLTTAPPAVVMVVVGLVGAMLALRTVTRADPLTALGTKR